jgi:hypothetical protein
MTAYPAKRAAPAFLIEFSVALAFYTAAALASGSLGTLWSRLAPLLAFGLMLMAVLRYYRRSDEFARRRFLESAALSLAAGCFALLAFAFLTGAGLPALALTWALPTLGACLLFTSAIRAVRG